MALLHNILTKFIRFALRANGPSPRVSRNNLQCRMNLSVCTPAKSCKGHQRKTDITELHGNSMLIDQLPTSLGSDGSSDTHHGQKTGSENAPLTTRQCRRSPSQRQNLHMTVNLYTRL